MPDSVGDETQVFEIHPTAKAYLGTLILGIILTPVAIGILLLLYVWYRVASVRYRLTTQRLIVQTGLIAKHLEEVELFRVKDLTLEQGGLQRILRYGSITVLSSDDTNPQLTLKGVKGVDGVKEQIRNAFRAARKREGLRTGEFIPS